MKFEYIFACCHRRRKILSFPVHIFLRPPHDPRKRPPGSHPRLRTPLFFSPPPSPQPHPLGRGGGDPREPFFGQGRGGVHWTLPNLTQKPGRGWCCRPHHQTPEYFLPVKLFFHMNAACVFAPSPNRSCVFLPKFSEQCGACRGWPSRPPFIFLGRVTHFEEGSEQFAPPPAGGLVGFRLNIYTIGGE